MEDIKEGASKNKTEEEQDDKNEESLQHSQLRGYFKPKRLKTTMNET